MAQLFLALPAVKPILSGMTIGCPRQLKKQLVQAQCTATKLLQLLLATCGTDVTTKLPLTTVKPTC